MRKHEQSKRNIIVADFGSFSPPWFAFSGGQITRIANREFAREKAT